MPGHPLGGPAQHRIAGQFGAVIADDGVRPAALCHHRFQLPHHAHTTQRSIHYRRQTLAAEVVQYAQDPEAAKDPHVYRAARELAAAEGKVMTIAGDEGSGSITPSGAGGNGAS